MNNVIYVVESFDDEAETYLHRYYFLSRENAERFGKELLMRQMSSHLGYNIFELRCLEFS